MPTIIVDGPTRLTPAFWPVSIVWRHVLFEAKWAEEGYTIEVICRGAHIHAKKILCETPSFSWRGWNKTRGSLHLIKEGIYRVKPETRDPDKAAQFEPSTSSSGMHGNSHLWVPPEYTGG